MNAVTILVVDDHKDVRHEVINLLRLRLPPATHLSEAANGDEALAVITDPETRPDIVLLDLGMPVSGHDVLGELEKRGLLNQVQVIIFSSFADYRNLVRTFRHGASDFVDKMHWHQELVPRIEARIGAVLTQREAQRLREELYRLAFCTGHDLAGGRQIPMRAAIETLREQLGNQGEALKVIDRLSAHLDSITEYAEDLREYAEAFKQGSVAENRERLWLGEILRRQLDEATDEEIDVEFLADPNRAGSAIWGERHQIERVFFNLLDNARKSLRSVSRRKRIAVSLQRMTDGTGVEVRVIDNGKGFPEHVLADPFTHRGEKKSDWGPEEPKGTGFGLSYCAEVIRNHGGRLTIASSGADGTTVAVELPVIRDAEEGANRGGNEENGTRSG